MCPFPFVPTVEVTDGSVEAFLSEDPVTILQEGKFFRGPFLAGVNNREGMLLLAGTLIVNEIFLNYFSALHFDVSFGAKTI